MQNNQSLVCFSRELFGFHLFGSADTLIKSLEKTPELLPMIQQTHEARKQSGHQLHPGIYFLVTCRLPMETNQVQRESGLVLPLSAGPSLGKEDPFRLNDEARTAIDQARSAVKTYFQTPDLPKLFCRFPDFLGLHELEGASLGLAVALAFIQTYSRRLCPFPVLVTGEITENSLVHRVDSTDAKIKAAWNELHEGPGVILIPKTPGIAHQVPENQAGRLIQVNSLHDAVLAIWGQEVSVLPEFIRLENFLEEVRKNFSFRDNISRIHQLRKTALPMVDQLYLTCELMIQHRHLGEIELAGQYQRELEETLLKDAEALDALACQEMEVQILATELDLFPGPEFRERCTASLARQSDMHNRIRVRGLLAKFESMNGNSSHSIQLRQENLKTHEKKSSLHPEKPFTLCHLVWECARAGEAGLFERYANELAELSASDDQKQWSYNHHALTAGAALLHQHKVYWHYLRTPGRQFLGAGNFLKEFFSSDATVTGHPNISTLRALIRICRRMGQIDEAVRLGRRFHVEVRPGDLTQWLFVTCGIERDLAWCERDGSGVEGIRSAPSKLLACHQPATLYYPELVAACEAFEFTPEAVAQLEKELDRLYY